MNHPKAVLSASLLLSLALAATGVPAQVPTTATIAQTGLGNQAYVEQRQAGEEATIAIVQTGNYNVIGDPAGRTGGVMLSETARMIVEITQLGDGNRLTLQHHEGGFFGFAYLHQSGTGNNTSLLQNGAYESTIRVEQNGERNVIEDTVDSSGELSFRPTQYGTDNVITTSRNLSGRAGLPVYQEGTANRATVRYDNAFYSGMAISQTGSDNQARGSLTLTGFATDASITQNGAGNLALTDIFESGGATTTQTGTANTATVRQNSGANGATISQMGALNMASVTQAGPVASMPNIAAITQIGEGFAASIAQTGSGNHAVILQH